MRKTVTREYRKLLTSYKCGKTVYWRNTCLNKVVRVFTRNGIDRLTVYITNFVRKVIAQTVNRSADTVKRSAKHFFWKRQTHRLAHKFCFSVGKWQIWSTLKNLYYRFITGNLNNSSYSFLAVVKSNCNHFFIECIVYSLDNCQRTLNIIKTHIFYCHMLISFPLAFMVINQLVKCFVDFSL